MSQSNRRDVLKLGAAAAAAALPFPGLNLAHAQSGPLKIGLITPLSGPQEFIGSYVKNGAEIAVDQINKAGGILGRQVALEIRDDKANPAAALAAARELLGAGINLHTGGISSAVVLAYLTGMVTAFILARSFVFTHSSQSVQRSAMFFVMVNGVAVLQTWGISMGLYYLLPFAGVTRWVPELAHAAGVIVPVFTSYLGHKRFSFR